MNPGTRIGPYEVVERLGAGGMGEVYRARDTKLGRDVALKILPEAFASEPDRRARFEREAKTLASLNHPHIGHIHGFEESPSTSSGQAGIRALVMELVEGEELAERIARGPIPIDEAIPIARQIADALEAAHEQGIIHRDLKPANIKVRRDGTVKVLDFGLAKALISSNVGPGFSPANPANSPTITSSETMGGMILGTAAYMSPEQARGKDIDKRSDIWAFGVVLYEMLTGASLFKGESVTDVLAAVVRQELDWRALPTDTPASVRRVLARCLERDPRRRLRDIGDARLELEAPEPAVVVAAIRREVPRYRSLLIAGIVALALVSAAAGWMLKRVPDTPTAPLIRASYPLGAALRLPTQRPQIAISPNGQFIATISGCCVALRRIDRLTSSVVEGSDDVQGVFFSPDNQSLGFWTDTTFKRVSLAGGGVTVIGEHFGPGIAGGPSGASWADDGWIYYGTLDGIRAISANGASSRVVLAGSSLAHPHVLPGSRVMLLMRGGTASQTSSTAEIVLHSLDGSAEDVVLTSGSTPGFLSSGHLLLSRGSDLLAAPLDVTARRLSREPVPVLQQVAMLGSFSQYAVSSSGTLVYVPGSAINYPGSRLVRVERGGGERPFAQPEREYSDPRLSPDGRLVALHLTDEQSDVWIGDLARGALTRFTFRAEEDETPAWSPDGRWIAYAGAAETGTGRVIWRRKADFTGGDEELWTGTGHSHVTDWSPDGRRIVFEERHPESRNDLFVLELGPPHKVSTYLQTPFEESSARISPNGRWLAYMSAESGRNEIYVQSFPTPGGKVQVSTGGGIQPVWSRDGRELYYRSETDLMIAPVLAGDSFSVRPPVPLFRDRYGRPQSGGHITYDVMPDGSFLFIQPRETADTSSINPVMIAVFNWFQELQAAVQGK